MDKEKIYNILLEVTQNYEHESEYDGRMYTRCNYCGVALSEDVPHSKDCLLLKINQTLKEEFPEEENERQFLIDLEEAYSINNYIRSSEKARWEEIRRTVHCRFCREIIQKENLKTHVHSARCKKTQRALVEAGELTEVNPTINEFNLSQHKPKETIMTALTRKQQYEANVNIPVGGTIRCPQCGNELVKKTWQQQFCSTSHKDDYWNAQPSRNRKFRQTW